MDYALKIQIEDELKCLHCHEKSVTYIWDKNKKLIRFYVNPDLEDEKVRHVFELRDIIREKDPPETYCMEMKCVSCGKWAIGYCGIPFDWEARKGRGRLEAVYIPQSSIIASYKADKYKEKKEEGEE